MSTEYRESTQAQQVGHSGSNMTRPMSRTSHHSIPRNAPIEPGHSLSTGVQLVHDQEKPEEDDEYGHQFVMKRLKRDIPLPGRWTLMIML
jgi:hypothetical protein